MHLLVVLVIAMLVFGPKKLPELGKSLGHGIRGFKESLEGKDEARGVDAGEPAGGETVVAKAEGVPEGVGAQAGPDAR